jgi:hypothetical protein
VKDSGVYEAIKVKEGILLRHSNGDCTCLNSEKGKDGRCSYCGGNNPKEIKLKGKKK